MNAYVVGELVRCSAEFETAAGIAVDPSAVVFRARLPDGTTLDYTFGTDAELVKDSVGNYHVDLDITLAGRWQYRFEGTGSGQAAAEAGFRVEASRAI